MALVVWCKKISRYLSLVLLLVWFSTNPAAAESRPIRFAPLPMENRETVVKQFRPMLFYLEEKLKQSVQIDFSDGYGEIIEKFRAGLIDLAYLGPLPYVELRRQYPQAEPLVHFNEPSGKPTYTCAIVAVADAGLKLEGLRGKKVALTQFLSTCGYLSVAGLLRQRGTNLEENSYSYLDKHDAVALAVVRGEFDAGGLKTAIGKKYQHLGLNILAETEPMPGFAIVANQATLPLATQHAIRTLLTQLDPAGEEKDMIGLWGENLRHGATDATDNDYDPVRLLKGDMLIPAKDKK